MSGSQPSKEVRARHAQTDKFKSTQSKYQSTYLGKKSRMKAKWISRGVKLREDEDWDGIFCCYYTTTNCMNCCKDITDSRQKCLDHCHKTGFIRLVCCKSCNWEP